MLNLTSEMMSELCDVYGNAFYLLDSKKFSNNFVELSNEFKKIYPNFNIAYSYKTNYTQSSAKS